MTKLIDITNQEFGWWKIVSYNGYHKNGGSSWNCLCKCGNLRVVSSSNIKSGASKSCGCAESKLGNGFRGFGKIGKDFWSTCVRNSLSRNIEHNINIEYAWNVFLTQNSKCSLSNMDIGFGNYTSNTDFKKEQTSSLDRIDSLKGYIEGNVQWLHKDINLSKHTSSNNEYINMCRDIIDFKESRKSSRLPTYNSLIGKKYDKLTVVEYYCMSQSKVNEWLCLCDCGKLCLCNENNLLKNNKRKVKTLSCGCTRYNVTYNQWSGYKDIGLTFFTETKKDAIKRNLRFDFNITQLWDLLEKQNFKCNISNKQLFISRSPRIGTCNSISLDRIDSSLGYVTDNIQWVDKKVNIAKHNFSQDYFVKLCENVVNHNKGL